MAASVLTLSVTTRRPLILAPPGPFGIVCGTVNLTSYCGSGNHTSRSEVTGLFKPSGLLVVVCDGASSGGYLLRFDNTTKDFFAYVSAAAASVFGEATAAANVGTFSFMAIGQLG